MHSRLFVGTTWSRALTAVLTASSVIVPCVFVTTQDDVFTEPKLVTLWAVLGVSFVLLAGASFVEGSRALTPIAIRPFDAALVAFLLLNFVAFALSIDQHQSLYGERYQLQGLLTILLYAGFFYLARLVFITRARTTMLFAGVVIGGTLVAIYGLLQELRLDPIWHSLAPGDRVFSSLGQPDALAGYLVIPLALAFAFLASGRVVQVLTIAAIGLMMTCLVLTGSRGGFLAATVVLLVAGAGLAWRGNVSPRRGLALLAAAGLVAAALYLTVAPIRSTIDRSWERAVSSTNTTGDISIAYHLDFWHEAVRIASDHPLFGTGQETYPEVFPRYMNDLPYLRAIALSKFRVESAHNVYLNIAAGSGLPALAAYVGLIAVFLVEIARAARATSDPSVRLAFIMLSAAVLGHLVSDTFVSPELTSSWLFWMLMGAGLAIASEERHRISWRPPTLGVQP